MLTFENLLIILRNNCYPYLELYQKQYSFDSGVFVGRFHCETCGKDEPPEQKTEKAIEWLKQQVKLFPDDVTFSIEAKTSPRANQQGVVGPFFFKKEVTEKKQNISGLNGLNPYEFKKMGYVTEADVQVKQLEAEIERLKQLHEFEKMTMQQNFQFEADKIQNGLQRWTPQDVSNITNEALRGLALLFGKPVETAGLGSPESEVDSVTLALKNSLNDKLKDMSAADLMNIEKLTTTYLERKTTQQK